MAYIFDAITTDVFVWTLSSLFYAADPKVGCIGQVDVISFVVFSHTRCGSFRPMNERNYLDLEMTRTPFSFFENRDRRQRFVTHKIDGVSGRGEIALCTLQLPI